MTCEKGATSWTQSWSNLYACPLHFTASYFFRYHMKSVAVYIFLFFSATWV